MSKVSVLPRLGLLMMLSIGLLGCVDDSSSPFYNYESAGLSAAFVNLEIGDEKLNVTGEVLNGDNEELEIAGVAIGRTPDFDFFSAPKFISDSILSNGRFFVELDSLPIDTTIFMVAFVGQSRNLGRSEIMRFSTIGITPLEAPCQFPEEQITIYGITSFVSYTGSYTSSFDNSFVVQVEGRPDYEMEIVFERALSEGIYTTVDANTFYMVDNPQEILINVSRFFESDQILPGGRVYITELPGNQFRFETCDLRFINQGDTLLQQFNFIFD